MKSLDLNKEQLFDLYINQILTIPEISKLLGFGKTTIHRYLCKYNIPRRPPPCVTQTTGICRECNNKVQLGTLCKKCSNSKYYKKNKDSIKKKQTTYRTYRWINQKEYMLEYYYNYRSIHREEIKKNRKKYQQSNEQAIIRKRLRERLRTTLRNQGLEKTKPSKRYGLDFQKIIEFLGPCPGKRSEWDIDHIFPLVSFDLREQVQIQLAMLPQNHQWLPKKENLIKHDYYDLTKWTQYVEEYTKLINYNEAS